jgi:AcrR family transcriptional regulator
MSKVASKNKESSNYHHGDLRRALMRNGLALLEQSENANLSLRQLARLAGVSPGAVYRHFASKEELLVALAVEGFSRLTQEQSMAYLNMKKVASSMEAFRAGGAAYVRFACQNPALFRLMFGRFSATHRNEALARASKLNRDMIMLSIGKVLASDRTEDELHALSVGTWAMIHGLSALILEQQLQEEEADLDDLVERIIRGASDWG